MTKSSILIELDDARSEASSASEVADKLKIPLNTVSYNLNKLVKSGLIEQSKGFFWSRKGKKMERYKIANKRIVIMPKQMVKGVLPAVIFAGLAALGVKLWTQNRIESGAAVESMAEGGRMLKATQEAGTAAFDAAPFAMREASQGAAGLCTNEIIIGLAQSAWLWFLVGALSALFVYLIWNFFRGRQ